MLLLNSILLLAVGVTILRSLWSAWMNITTIESWEIERHETLLRRAKAFGGYLDGPNGIRMPIQKQEFPYDIGILENLNQAFGTGPLTWLWPLAPSPSNESGLAFEVNGFEGKMVQLRVSSKLSRPHMSQLAGHLPILTVFPESLHLLERMRHSCVKTLVHPTPCAWRISKQGKQMT